MKILVTGGAGFIGSHVVDMLVAGGHQVVVVDDLSTGQQENVNPAAVFYRADIRSPELLAIFEKEHPDVVDHHAALANVRESQAKPALYADVNILGSINLLECARRTGVRKFIYISTGGAEYGEPQYLPVDESHPIQPLCPYGASKHSVEHYLFIYQRLYGLNYTTLRYANVYGPRQDPYGEAGVVAIFAERMLSGKQAVINGNGDQERDFVYVEDYARANLLALDKGSGGTFNLASGQGTSINTVFRLLARLTHYGLEEVHGPAKPGEVFKIYLSIEKAKRELGWSPVTGMEEGLQRTVQFFSGRK
jgi:UDP-glucose 4-epimerase